MAVALVASRKTISAWGLTMFAIVLAALVGGTMTFAYCMVLQDALLAILLAPFGASLFAFLLCAFPVAKPRHSRTSAPAWRRAFRS